MPFIQKILNYKNVAIVGMAKNTGKTTCLNYVLDRLHEEKRKVAVTSIGVDGEERDVLYNTLKPRIQLKKGNYFITSEKHFSEREIGAEILSMSDKMTALGRLVIARATGDGRIVLSGPSDSAWLGECIALMDGLDVDITLVDGALSRMSLASPAITDAMILCTGAACAIQLEKLTQRVKYLCGIISIKTADDELRRICSQTQSGVWALNRNSAAEKIADSLFTNSQPMDNYLEDYEFIFINGALTEFFLKALVAKRNLSGINLIVRDFSHIFVTPATYQRFLRCSGKIQVLQQAKLLALCTNPTSPEGYNYEPEILRNHLEKNLKMPVYDIVQEIKNRKVSE